MAALPTFEEWVKGLYDYNGDGKLRGAERTAYNRALNKRNKTQTYQLYAQYVATLTKNEGIENEQSAQATAQAQQAALLQAAVAGNEAAQNLLTGDTKQNIIAQYGKYILLGLAGVAVIALLIFKK